MALKAGNWPMRLTQPQAANPSPLGLQQKVPLVLHRAVYGHDVDSHIMKCPTRLCTEAIKLTKNKFVLHSVQFRSL